MIVKKLLPATAAALDGQPTNLIYEEADVDRSNLGSWEDFADFNSRWLQEWTNKSVEGVMSFYHPEIEYFDENVPDGITGADALRSYLPQVFTSVPEWIYHPEIVWAIDGGFCGRWYMDLGTGAELARLRGFDQVLIKDGLIVHNEVYTHRLTTKV